MALEPGFRVKVVTLASALDAAGIPFAIGGAIGFGVWAEPRGTVDIDVDVFLPEADVLRVVAVLRKLGAAVDEESASSSALRDGQVRVDWAGTYVDLFFAYDAFHASCARRSSRVDFYGSPVPVLSAEDVVVFKVLFNRPKDWIDIGQLLTIQGARFDFAYARRWLETILGADDSRIPRLQSLLRA